MSRRKNIYVPADIAGLLADSGNASGYIADAVRHYAERVPPAKWAAAPTTKMIETEAAGDE